MHLNAYRNLIHTLAFAFVLLCVTGTGPAIAAGPPFARFLEGSWDEGGDKDSFCAPGRNLRRINSANDGKSITWELDEEIEFLDGKKTRTFTYKVLGYTGFSLTLALDGEARKNSRGEPFVWELVAVTPGRMRWRSTDFEFGVYNNVWLVRCSR